ncbi:hydantoinase/oxoprolinase family protein [Streptomyces paludis]|uniref:Hydantoinase/oxoprolinase family protein n=1 Tax=Streptomyces paludis TaxID=2282738 RepID=A0A345HYS2_9ACTN|nr:hydantoinase/oxoprolinase family protein [Streptomyces paludis]AXG81846.1 hydantoinase/oxoprolinase family protein [Streptomyces paludis]
MTSLLPPGPAEGPRSAAGARPAVGASPAAGPRPVPPRFRIGVDVGGTFTDVVLAAADGSVLHTAKVPSEAAGPAAAVVRAVSGILARHHVSPDQVEFFAHGQTFALNTVLQRSGARTGLLVTRGFPDLLDIGRLRLRDPIDFFAAPRRPLVERGDVREIPERTRVDGTVDHPLDEEALLEAARDLLADGVEALAVVFLHSHAHPGHEQRAVTLLRRAHPGLIVAGSCELWPEEKEYERATVAVLAAHVAGLLRGYLGDLSRRMRAAGLHCPLHITKSNGGVMSVDSVLTTPNGPNGAAESEQGAASLLRAAVETLLSGPAAGVAGAVRLASAAGVRDLVTMDMGGTSVDSAIVEDGRIPYSTDSELGDFPLITPSVEVSSIGAGGGSVAWLDASGVLKVGPRSAGARPGPACYGRGGKEPTLTDAYVVCGYLDPDDFAGGVVGLDRDAAREAFAGLAGRLDMDVEYAAEAVVNVATAMMHARLVPLLARRGVDPAQCRLVPYGGAGPVQAVALARELGIRRLLVPWSPGTLCAFGALVTDLRHDLVASVGATTGTLDDARLESGWKELEERAHDWYREQSASLHHEVGLTRWADVQLAGQSFTLAVTLPEDERPTVAALRAAFTARYRAAYGVDASGRELDVRSLRVTLTARSRPLTPRAVGGTTARPRPHTVVEDGRLVPAERVRRAELAPGTTLRGPLVVSAPDATLFLPTGATVEADAMGNLLIDAGEARGKAS